MSANDKPPDIEVEADLPPDPNSLRGRFLDQGVRTYLFVGLGALVMIFLVLLQQGSDIGGLGFLMVGTVGLIFRWPTVPPFLLLWLDYPRAMLNSSANAGYSFGNLAFFVLPIVAWVVSTRRSGVGTGRWILRLASARRD